MNKEKQKVRKVSEKKKKILQNLVDLIKKNNTVMILSIDGIPSAQFQKTKKELKEIADITVVKKKVVEKAIQDLIAEKKNIEQLKDSLEKPFAILFSNKDAFEIAAMLNKNKIPSRAKSGQIAPQDIVLEAGPTELVAGPALSELTKLGIKAGVDSGKITIKERKVIAKKGDLITEDIASTLSKLEITPFLLSILPITAYDSKSLNVYQNIQVDPEKVIKELQICSTQALGFAINLGYVTSETIKLLMFKASQEALLLSQNIKN
jgi:large subunit ribosomal protein L10